MSGSYEVIFSEEAEDDLLRLFDLMLLRELESEPHPPKCGSQLEPHRRRCGSRYYANLSGWTHDVDRKGDLAGRA